MMAMITVRFYFGFGTGGTIQILSNNGLIMFAVGMECVSIHDLQHFVTYYFLRLFFFLCCAQDNVSFRRYDCE